MLLASKHTNITMTSIPCRYDANSYYMNEQMWSANEYLIQQIRQSEYHQHINFIDINKFSD